MFPHFIFDSTRQSHTYFSVLLMSIIFIYLCPIFNLPFINSPPPNVPTVAAMQVDGMGMFPLHVACKAGRDWKITGAIYESYKPAIKEVIDGVASIPTATTAAAANKDVVRGSTPLHLALARQDSPHTLIRALVDSHKGACEHLDRKGQQPLHLAAAVAGEEIIRIVLAGHPEALITPDDRGRVPLACAALSCCHNIDTVERTEIECNVPVRGSISKIESMYTLLRAAPNVLDLKFLRSC